MRKFLWAVALGLALVPWAAVADMGPQRRFALFDYLNGSPTPTLVTYAPSQLDPRQEANQRRLATSSIRADLETLRPAFDGLVLYGYHEACTPRILAVAKDLKFRAVVLAVWDPKSAAEVDGVAALARQYEKDLALGVLIGNEGLTFKRYEAEDLRIAAARLRGKIPRGVPISTSEPLFGYKLPFVRGFGDFLAPNIHPVFDRPQLGPAEAAAWVREEAGGLARQTGRPVLVKETGFPHGGKPAYTPASQKAFWEAYVKPGLLTRTGKKPAAWVYCGVAFDAFDLAWKSQETGLPVEQHWGLLSAKRVAYPALGAWQAVHAKAGAGAVDR
jgi:exo-beta-1,3-glucanase (GH17 family)